jgi:fluoride ion exporter CrcB/FEX
MNAWLISLLVFAIIFGGALLGVVLRPLLSEDHLHPDSRDVVKMATGLIGTLTALVLGLLIASAKNSFDQKTNQVRQMTASVILLDDRPQLAQSGRACPS